jgi:GT2 family glycosyltransferase
VSVQTEAKAGKKQAMKHRAALRTEVSLSAEGVVTAVWRGAGATSLTRAAVALDGVVQAILPVTAARGARRLTYALPTHALAGELTLLSAGEAAPLLPLPFKLANAYDIEPTSPLLEGMVVTGSFSAAAFLADTITAALKDGPATLASGLAHRDKADGHFRYRMAVHALPPPGAPLRGILVNGGLPIPGATFAAPPGALGYVGCLDMANPARVEGWAVNLQKPDERVTVEILIGTDTVGCVIAGEKRPDVAIPGVPPFCGFSFDLPDPEDPRAPKRIAARIAGQRTELTGSPSIVEPMPQLQGRFDTLHGMSAHGWAIDLSRPDKRVMVEAVGPDGQVLGEAPANIFRGDLLGAGLADGLCAFKIDLTAHYDRLIGQEITVRFAGTNVILPNSPQRILPNGNMQRFLRRKDVLRNKPGVLPRLRRALTHRAGTLGISIIMPVFDTPRTWLSEALESVRHQFCDNWELICIDDGSAAPHVKELLGSYARADSRVRVLSSPKNMGVARSTNFGLRAARYPYVTFLDHDDSLEPDAVWQLIRAVQLTNADLLYGDEVLTDENLSGILEFRLRPAFSHDYYLSHPYFVHPICVRTELAHLLGGWDESLQISADVDFVLRLIENARKVAHVPAVLYRWRTHPSSTGHAKQKQVMAATIHAIERHLKRLGKTARVGEGPWFNQFRIDYPDPGGTILIVIPTKNGRDLLEKSITSIERTAGDDRYRLVVIDHESDDPATKSYLAEIKKRHIVMPYQGPFNFSRMNNQAVTKHGADTDFVLFLNNDIEATQDGWLGRLRSLAARPEIGGVGALLMYPDQRVQHAGVVLGFNNSADHALRLQEVYLDHGARRNLGYNCALTSVREYSAVTAACLMMRKSVFEEINGFDEKFGIGFNDTDLCLRAGAAGYKILYDGYTILYHYESATRSQTKQVFHPTDTKRMVKRWGAKLAAGDPFYNPNLSLRTQDHVPREDSACRVVNAPRVIEQAVK